jgi:aspartyl-tRNA(Asn)/glutamyl-tRNA(Gln) amidotransferase subunit A
VIAGHDARDATSYPQPAPNWLAALSGSADGLRIGVPRGFFDGAGADPETLARAREALRGFESLGAKTVEVELPNSAYGIATYYLICTAEAASNLSRYDGVKFGFRAASQTLDEMYEKTRSEGFGAEVKRRILLGTYVLSAGYYDAYYRKAQQVRTLIRRDFERAFESCDLIATPTTPGPAWRLGELVDDPLQMYLADVYTVTANLAGLPALSIPCGVTGAGLPVGLQLIGQPLDEATVLRAGDAFQRQTHYHELIPEGFGS